MYMDGINMLMHFPLACRGSAGISLGYPQVLMIPPRYTRYRLGTAVTRLTFSCF